MVAKCEWQANRVGRNGCDRLATYRMQGGEIDLQICSLCALAVQRSLKHYKITFTVRDKAGAPAPAG